MKQKELTDMIHKHLYTRKIDIETGILIQDTVLIKEFNSIVERNNQRILKTISSSDSQYFHVIHHFQSKLHVIHIIQGNSNLKVLTIPGAKSPA